MKLSHGPALVPSLSFTDAPDIHLLFMAGVVLIAGVAGVGSVSLLLLFAPFGMLFLGRAKPRRVAAVTAGAALGSGAGTSRPPSNLSGVDRGD